MMHSNSYPKIIYIYTYIPYSMSSSQKCQPPESEYALERTCLCAIKPKKYTYTLHAQTTYQRAARAASRSLIADIKHEHVHSQHHHGARSFFFVVTDGSTLLFAHDQGTYITYSAPRVEKNTHENRLRIKHAYVCVYVCVARVQIDSAPDHHPAENRIIHTRKILPHNILCGQWMITRWLKTSRIYRFNTSRHL